MRVLDDIVLRFGTAGIPGQAASGAQLGEILSPREDLVDVGLVAGVKDDGVLRRVKDPVQRDGELDNAQVGAEVSARARHGLDEEVSDLLRQLG